MSESDAQNLGTMRKLVLTFILVLISTLILSLGTASQVGFIENPNLVSEEDNISTLDAVPADANLFLRYDVEGIESSNTTRSIYSEEFTYDKFLKSIDKTSDSKITDSERNISNLGEVIVFGKSDLDSITLQNQYFGTMIETSDSAEDIIETVSSSEEYTQQTYKGYRMLLSNETNVTVGVLSAGEFYIISDKKVVENVIDTAKGDRKSVDTDKVPKAEGDTHANLAAYNITGMIGNTDFIEYEERLPESTFVSYSSLGDKILVQIRINYKSSVGSDSNINLPEMYKKDSALDYRVSKTDTGVIISYSASPDKVESDITNFVSPELTNYELPTRYGNT